MTTPFTISEEEDIGSSSLLQKLKEQNQKAFPGQACPVPAKVTSPLKPAYSINDVLGKVSFVKESLDDSFDANTSTALNVSLRNHNSSHEEVVASINIPEFVEESEPPPIEAVPEPDLSDTVESSSPPTTEEDSSSEIAEMRLRSTAETESPKVIEKPNRKSTRTVTKKSTVPAEVKGDDNEEVPVTRTTRKSTRIVPNPPTPVRPEITRAKKKPRSASGDNSLTEAPQKKRAVESKPVTPKPASRKSRVAAASPKTTPETPAVTTPMRTTRRTKPQAPVESDEEDHDESMVVSPDPEVVKKGRKVSAVEKKSSTPKAKATPNSRKSTRKVMTVTTPEEEADSESDLDDPNRIRTPSPRFHLWPIENP